MALSIEVPAPARRGLVVLAGLAVLAGMWAGLIRIGWLLPTTSPDLAALHGPLMVGGFLGVVISLERAVALGQTWGFGAPALAGLGSLVLLVGLPAAFSAALLVAASALLMAIFVRIYRLRPEWSTVLLLLGAALWLVGNTLWLVGQPITSVVMWWIAFLVLTIVGERLELAQVLLPAGPRVVLLASAGLLVGGLGVSAAAFALGTPLVGVGLVAVALWLLRYDVARRNLGRVGLARFNGMALLLGYMWLGAAGLLWLLGPERAGGFSYDAMLHSVFLGFAFSMIFAHAPTIVPAITGFSVPFHGTFYVHLALLHVSLALRIVGDLAMQPEARRWGGLLNVIAVLLFAGVTAQSVRAVRPSELSAERQREQHQSRTEDGAR